METNKSTYPEWANWKAVDADGSVYVFENKPVLCSKESYPFELENTFTEVASVWGDPTHGRVRMRVNEADWKSSLEEVL
jgi:hypothetical protein